MDDKKDNVAISGIALIGFMASGKTCTGRILARRLLWNFADLDDEIEKAAGMSVGEIFRAEGENGFRTRESTALAEVSGQRKLVLSCGGGTVLVPQNREILSRGFFVVWLKVSPETAVSRAASGQGMRPLLDRTDLSSRVRDLMAQREKIYETCARLTVNADRDDPETTAEIIHDHIRISI